MNGSMSHARPGTSPTCNGALYTFGGMGFLITVQRVAGIIGTSQTEPFFFPGYCGQRFGVHEICGLVCRTV